MVPVGPGGAIDIGAMMNQPQIQQLRQMLQHNPALLQPLLQQLAQQNPDIAPLFAEHPEALAQLIGMNLEEGGANNAGDEQPQYIQIELSEEDRASIQRVSILLSGLACALY